MSDEDWDNMDPEMVLATAPLRLTERHIESLKLKFGEDAALNRIQTNVSHALRRVRIIPPNRRR